MERRKYTKIQTLEAEIASMHEDGKAHREIAEHFGLERIQVKRSMRYWRRFAGRGSGGRWTPISLI